MRGSRAAAVALLALSTPGCTDAPKPDPHYVLGPPYKVGMLWYYPRESYDLDEAGLAGVAADRRAGLTTDGEVFDQTAMAAASPTLQLPAIVRLTNLDNGLQVTVRVNDRGSGDPHRLIEVSRHVARLLGITGVGAPGLATTGAGVAPVRLQVLTVESRTAADALPGAPHLALTAAPREVVAVTALPAPSGVRQSAAPALPPGAMPAAVADAELVPPPMRLPDSVARTVPRPGRLMVHLDSFDTARYAAIQQAKMSTAGARIVASMTGRRHQYRVELGPFQDVAQADAVLDQALARGIPDARIVID